MQLMGTGHLLRTLHRPRLLCNCCSCSVSSGLRVFLCSAATRAKMIVAHGQVLEAAAYCLHRKCKYKRSSSGAMGSVTARSTCHALPAQKMQEEIEQFLCPARGYAKASHTSIGRLYTTHSGERYFQCSVCMKNFRDRSNLVRHFRIHTGEKPYQCIHCSKSFTQSNSLTSHLRTHTVEKPCKCHVCPKAFASLSELRSHVRVHKGPEML